MKPAEWVEILRYLSMVTGIGLIFSAAVWLGWLLGSSLEHQFGGVGWLVAGLLVGIAAGFIAIYSTLKKIVRWE